MIEVIKRVSMTNIFVGSKDFRDVTSGSGIIFSFMEWFEVLVKSRGEDIVVGVVLFFISFMSVFLVIDCAVLVAVYAVSTITTHNSLI